MIQSILDNDWYKFLMGNAVFQCYPHVQVKYKLFDRGSTLPKNYNAQSVATRLQSVVANMSKLTLSEEELEFLQKQQLPDNYLDYLFGYRYDPKEVVVYAKSDRELEVAIEGKWTSAIMWEVPLLALISEFTLHGDTEQLKNISGGKLIEAYAKSQGAKAEYMHMVNFSEFGTRRRRSFEVQEAVVKELARYPNCLGTSNVYLAMKHGLKPSGTVAHEWYMGISALEGLSHANKHAMQIWLKHLPKGQPRTVLTDTFHTDTFLLDFNRELAEAYDVVRQDSGDPNLFIGKLATRFNQLGIDSLEKGVLFSDGLTPAKAIEVARNAKRYFGNVSVGIGTNFTNDFVPFGGNPAMNIVIKLTEVNGFPVVKLSDVESKATGDIDAIRVAKWTFAKRYGQKRDL